MYELLIARTTCCAINRCADALGWNPSHENARPNGDAEQGAPKLGNGATCVGIARRESSVGFVLAVPADRTRKEE